MNFAQFLPINLLWIGLTLGKAMAQPTSSEFKLVYQNTIQLPENTERTFVDYGNNLYFVAKDQVVRRSLALGFANVQSQKIWQNIDQILAINSMKTVVFSQAQQQLCFTDNTLSNQGTCIDLQEYDLNNVTVVAASKRPDMLWLYDELNSTLLLFNFVQRQIIQSVSNLRGILNLKGEPDLMENTSALWIFTNSGQVIRMDDYLNAISQQELVFSSIVPYRNGCFLIRDHHLYYETLLAGETLMEEISTLNSDNKLHISGNQLIIEKGKALEVFIIQEK